MPNYDERMCLLADMVMVSSCIYPAKFDFNRKCFYFDKIIKDEEFKNLISTFINSFRKDNVYMAFESISSIGTGYFHADFCEPEDNRTYIVQAMNEIIRCINDEDIIELWLMNGVADGDDKLEDYVYYTADDDFADLMALFVKIMKIVAKEESGLFIDGILGC